MCSLGPIFRKRAGSVHCRISHSYIRRKLAGFAQLGERLGAVVDSRIADQNQQAICSNQRLAFKGILRREVPRPLSQSGGLSESHAAAFRTVVSQNRFIRTRCFCSTFLPLQSTMPKIALIHILLEGKEHFRKNR